MASITLWCWIRPELCNYHQQPYPLPDSGDLGSPQHFAEEAHFESTTLGTDDNQMWREGAGRLKVKVRRGWRDAWSLVKKPGSQGQAQPLPLTQDLELVVGVPRSPACCLFHVGREQRAVVALRRRWGSSPTPGKRASVREVLCPCADLSHPGLQHPGYPPAIAGAP